MRGLMQDFPLLVHRVLDHAARWHGKATILSRSVEGPLHRSLAVLFGKYGSTLVHVGTINGLPGFVTREADGEFQTSALEIENGKVAGIYVMRNPDKLKHMH